MKKIWLPFNHLQYYTSIICLTLTLSFDNHLLAQSVSNIAEQAFDAQYDQALDTYATLPDIGLAHAKKAAEIALQHQLLEQIGKAHYMTAYIYKMKGDLPNAFNYFLGAEKAYKAAIAKESPGLMPGSSKKLMLLKTLRNVQEHLGIVSMDNNSLSTAVKMYHNRLKTARQIDDRSIAQAYFDLGLAHYFANKLDSSFWYFTKGKSLYKHGGFYNSEMDSEDLSRIYFQIGVIYDQLGRDLNLPSQFDSAVTNYLETINLTPSEVTMAMAWNNIGYTKIAQRDYENAARYVQKAIKVNERLAILRNGIDNYNNMGIIHFSTGQMDSAIFYFNKAVDANIGFDDYAKNIRDTELAIEMNQNPELATSFYYLDSLRNHGSESTRLLIASRIVERNYEMIKSGRFLVQAESQSIIDQMYQADQREEQRKARNQMIQDRIIYAFIGLLALIILYLTYHYIKYRSLKKALNINLKRILHRTTPPSKGGA